MLTAIVEYLIYHWNSLQPPRLNKPDEYHTSQEEIFINENRVSN